jgi:proteasome assembly chaperone (PAC2) family protein
MSETTWLAEPDLDRPLMVVAFRGLFDTADAATSAVRWLQQHSESRELADIDPETFFDFTQERPLVSLDPDGERVISWPENRAFAARTPDGQRDLVLVAGVEPHLRWRTFSEELAAIAEATSAEMVITLGSMVGMTPHTRPLAVVGSSTNRLLAGRMGLGSPSYQGPTGVVGTLHDSLDKASIPVISLRVSVPHYVPASPNPMATLSLLRRFELVTGVHTDHKEFNEPAAEWRQRVDAAVAEDEEISAYVRQLEGQVDENEDFLPTGDELAAELEAFLRDQRPE